MVKRLIISLLLSAFYNLSAQEADTNTVGHSEHLHTEAAKHNIKRATTLAPIPGVGQFYTKMYWKIPLVWGAIGEAGYYYYDLDTSKTIGRTWDGLGGLFWYAFTGRLRTDFGKMKTREFRIERLRFK